MMAGGLIAVLARKYSLGYGVGFNEALRGMLTGFAIYGIGDSVSRVRARRTAA